VEIERADTAWAARSASAASARLRAAEPSP
jgi:hypothetical protein